MIIFRSMLMRRCEAKSQLNSRPTSRKAFALSMVILALLGPVMGAQAQGMGNDETTAVSTGASSAAVGGFLSQSSQGMGTTAGNINPAMQQTQLPTLTDANRQLQDTTRQLQDSNSQDPQFNRRNQIRPLQPSQFQKFVQESTGRLLPIFGSDLFDSQQNFADPSLPAPAEYILGPGDEVRIQLWGAVDYSGSHTLDRNGQINVPKVGTISLAGIALRDVEGVLRSNVSKVFTNFQLSIALGRLRSVQVYIVGQARQPGTYKLSSLSTLISALFMSGGPNGNGSMRNIQLSRNGKIVSTLDLYDFITKGDKGKDVPLQAGDVIVIPPVGARIAVTGALDQAAIYELKSTTGTVGEVLAISGGVPALAKAQKALIERIDSSKTSPRQVVQIGLDPEGLKQPLQDGDVLTMLPISQAFSNAVTLQGAVAEPIRNRWFSGMRLLDLIPDREALISPDYYKRKNSLVLTTNNSKEAEPNSPKLNVNSDSAGSKTFARVKSALDQINWDYAVIERLDKNNLTTKLITFNLGKAVIEKDPASNIELLEGDVITIFSQNDLRLPQERQNRLVRVEGEVVAPGVYQAQPGETLPQLIRRLGGLSTHAYVFGTEFTRETVRQRQQENLDSLIRRLEAQSQSQSGSALSNLKTADNVAQAQAIVQQQQAQLKSQIERLKAMRSNGRMALELDPNSKGLTNLPPVPLEDGDRIVIPSTPSFVSAFGSVNNENVFLYRPGKTVSEVVKSAGLTEDAEPDQAFLLRADGSIISRRDHSGFFGGNFETLPLMPGDTLVVPAQIDRESKYNFTIRALKDWTQILANMGLGLAAIKTLNP